jgi:pimeloyl-ACP methyl ester carboxylesterase
MFDARILLCRLQSQVLDLDGVGDAWLGPFIEGGLRGGSVTMQTEVEKRLPLSMLIKSIQALDDALLVLPFKTNYWLWRGNKINYAVAGCGKPLILIHGFGGNAGHFARLIPYLAENYRVYAIDLLGFGASDKPANVEYGPELWADLVCGVSSFPQSSWCV